MSINVLNNIFNVIFSHTMVKIRVLKAVCVCVCVCVCEDFCLLGEANNENNNTYLLTYSMEQSPSWEANQ